MPPKDGSKDQWKGDQHHRNRRFINFSSIESLFFHDVKLTYLGVKDLHGTTHTIMPDRIEIGTYMIAASITGSELFLSGGTCDYLTAFIDVLRQMV